MRILTVGNMYPPHHLGGYELMWRSAVAHLRAGGHEVRVLTTDYRRADADPDGPGDEEVFRDLRWYWHDHDFPPATLRARVGLERHNAAVLADHLEGFAPDVVSWWAMGGMSLSLLEQVRRAGPPAAATVVDDWLLYGPSTDAWSRLSRRAGRLAGALERATGVPARIDVEHAARWLFASRTLLSRARDAGWRLPEAKVSHPGIDRALFDEPREAREDWAWRLLYCGRIDPRKGIATAVDALAGLPESATLRVIGAGDPRHLGELRALAAAKGVTERVSFERLPRRMLPAAYADADLTLFPVLWEEPFGLVPLESMAMGTPVVASGRGGSGEYLRDAGNCALFEADGGATALRAAVERVAGDPALREQLHAGGLATAASFTESGFNETVADSLARALEAGSPHG